MKINGRDTRTIWPAPDGSGDVEVLDQTLLPHRVEVARLASLADAARAISTMQVRGAPLIGATAAYGVCLAMRADPSDAALAQAHATLLATRPTAVNLAWALDQMTAVLAPLPPAERHAAALRRAACSISGRPCRPMAAFCATSSSAIAAASA